MGQTTAANVGDRGVKMGLSKVVSSFAAIQYIVFFLKKLFKIQQV